MSTADAAGRSSRPVDGAGSGLAGGQSSRLSVSDVLAALDLEQLGPQRWRGASVEAEGPVVFGGQLIGQAVVAAARSDPAKRVKSVHTVFARPGQADQPVTLDVDALSGGRTLAGITVTASQGAKRLAQSLVLLDADDADVIRHADAAPYVAGPEDAVRWPSALSGWEQCAPAAVDLMDPAAGPAGLAFWSRFEVGPQPPVTAVALLAWASLGPFIGTAMRPHEGVSLALAHRELSTGVLSHTMVLHAPLQAHEWLLLSLHGNFAGSGRAYGTGEAFTRDGVLAASYAQESMIRRRTGPSTL